MSVHGFKWGFVCACVCLYARVWEHSVPLFPSRSDVWLFLAQCSLSLSLSGAFGWVHPLVFLPVRYLCARPPAPPPATLPVGVTLFF